MQFLGHERDFHLLPAHIIGPWPVPRFPVEFDFYKTQSYLTLSTLCVDLFHAICWQ